MERKQIEDEVELILQEVKKYTLSLDDKDEISLSKFTNDIKILDDRHKRIEEILSLLDGDIVPSLFPSIQELFNIKSPYDLDGSLIKDIGEFLDSYNTLLKFLKKEDEIQSSDVSLSHDISLYIDTNGEVKEDNPRLIPLLKMRENSRNEREKYSTSFLRDNKNIISFDKSVYKNGRLSFPLKTNDKNKIKGYVVGESNSGETTLVEDFTLLSLNNEVFLSEERIRSEKLKIIHELSLRIKEIIPQVKEYSLFVKDVDFYYSFALYIKKNKLTHIEQGDEVRLINARHPLLKDKAVPITLIIPHKCKVLVLSGPNGGGKSVSMKTLGVLSYLYQICTYIPSSSTSTLPLFDVIFSDIGDGQETGKNSTFTEHMENISNIIKNATSSSLVLLDELCSGTDPEEGESLSIALLDYFSKNVYLTLATSHYNGVKNYAFLENNFLNSSMEYGKNTYKIISGLPGDSHAIETATRCGIDSKITSNATMRLKNDETSSLIKNISALKCENENIKSELIKREEEISKKEKELETKENILNNKLDELKSEGDRELSSFLSESRKTLENLVKDLREKNIITKDEITPSKEFINRIENKLSNREKRKKSVKKNELSFSLGESVYCGSNKRKGIIVSVNKENYKIQLDNGMKIDLPQSSLQKCDEKEKNRAEFKEIKRKAEYTLDLRGYTLNEALEKLDYQIESCILTSFKTFSIIHGFGDGVLQKGIWEYLKNNNLVSSFSFAHDNDGGMGKTYVEVKV